MLRSYYNPNTLSAAAALGSVMYSNWKNSKTHGVLLNPTHQKVPQMFRNGRSYSTVATKKRKRRGKRVSVKKLMLKAEPAKHMHVGDGVNSIAIKHNNIYAYNLTKDIVQGTSNTTRLGDEVELCALKFNISLQAPTTANGYTYRILVGYHTQTDTNTVLTYNVLSPSQIFLTNTGANWTCGGIINPKNFTVLYDSTHDINSQVSGTGDLMSVGETVPINQKFIYGQEAGAQGKTRNLFFVIMSNVIGGAANSTSTGAVALNTDLIFKE